jgi:DnaJ-class molecular chaperone
MDGHYANCENCGGTGTIVQYDMVLDEIITRDCRRCDGTGEVFIADESESE